MREGKELSSRMKFPSYWVEDKETMENKYKGMQGLQSLLERYKNVKIRIPDTLFDIEPSWDKLSENRCPICANKLLFPIKSKVGICRGKSHGDRRPFVIKLEVLARLGHRYDKKTN